MPSGTITRLRQSALVRGGLVVGAGILIGNITGFFRIAVTAYLLGTRANADALAVSTGFVDTLNNITINTLIVAFVPMLMPRQGADRLAMFAQAGRLFTGILLAASVVLALAAPWVISILGPGLAARQHDEAVVLMRWLAPAVLFAGCSGIYSALLYTERRFLAGALYQTCLNGGGILFSLLLWKRFGVYGFGVGYTVGAAVQLGLVWAVSRDLHRGVRSAMRFTARELLGRPGMYLIYAALVSMNLIVTRAFATHAGAGLAAAVDYAMRGVSTSVAYLVFPVANSLLPEIGRLRSEGEAPRAYRLINRSVGLMALAGVAASVVAVLFRRPVIALLFQRGSFTTESTALVSGVFLGFAPCLIGSTLVELISRCCFALDRPRLPLIAAVAPVTVNLVVLFALNQSGHLADPAALGLGTSIGLLAGFVALYGLTRGVIEQS